MLKLLSYSSTTDMHERIRWQQMTTFVIVITPENSRRDGSSGTAPLAAATNHGLKLAHGSCQYSRIVSCLNTEYLL